MGAHAGTPEPSTAVRARSRNNATTIEGIDTPAQPDHVARLAAIQATASSAVDIFETGYLETLRQDWPD